MYKHINIDTYRKKINEVYDMCAHRRARTHTHTYNTCSNLNGWENYVKIY